MPASSARPARVRLPRWLLVCLVCAALIFFLLPWLAVRIQLRSHLSSPWDGLFHHSLYARGLIPPSWVDAKPYAPETLEAYVRFVETASQVEATDACNEIEVAEAIHQFTRTGELEQDLQTSMKLVMGQHLPAMESFLELAAQPDFNPDISLYPKVEHRDVSMGKYAATILPVYLMHTCLTDADQGVSTTLRAYDCFLAARPRETFGNVCDRAIRQALPLLYATALQTQRSDLAAACLSHLNTNSMAAQDGERTQQQEIFDWTFAWYASHLREHKRAGYAVGLSQSMRGIDLIAEIDNLGGSSEISREVAPGNLFSQFLSKHDVPVWSTCAREMRLVDHLGSWAFSHVFPYGNSVAARMSGPTVDLTRLRYDEARLNLASAVFHANSGKWPAGLNELLPEYIPGEITDADALGGYQWDANANRFRVDEPAPVGIL